MFVGRIRFELRNQAIVVGGGLGGMSAANTVVENGGRVVLLDKSSFCSLVEATHLDGDVLCVNQIGLPFLGVFVFFWGVRFLK